MVPRESTVSRRRRPGWLLRRGGWMDGLGVELTGGGNSRGAGCLPVPCRALAEADQRIPARHRGNASQPQVKLRLGEIAQS